MRPRDVAEIREGWQKEPLEAMQECLRESYFARTMLCDLEPLCMYGLAPMMVLSGAARFWIFGTAAIDRHPLAFARACKLGKRELFMHCSLATNLIDVNDQPVMRWMQWMGGEALLPLRTKGGRVFAQFVIRGQNKGVSACLRA